MVVLRELRWAVKLRVLSEMDCCWRLSRGERRERSEGRIWEAMWCNMRGRSE